jgi:HAD superfamily phosphoserine phosphatase-like hydrolase
MAKRVFVSSTFSDLVDYRASVRDAIQKLGAVDIAMEKFGSNDERPKDLCIRIVSAETDIFVGIYAHRYGFMPAGYTISISQMEYEAAGPAGCKRLIYLIDEKVAWPPALIEDEPGKSALRRFKQKLQAEHVCTSFTTKDELAKNVAIDLAKHFATEDDPFTTGHRGLYHQPASTWASPVAANALPFKVVAFDLDGTLLRGDGFQFSWEAVWRGLGFSRGIQQKLKSQYRKRAQGAATPEARSEAYREWCREACRSFKTRKLDRARIRAFAQALSLTRNFESAMTELRGAGLVTAVISGGVHCFLEDQIPDFRSWFDFVFINELKFDDAGVISDVIATQYDFEGKADALKLICERVGCTLEETVFVGDGFNDETILLAAGKSIGYPPADQAVEGASKVLIEEDDLELLLPHILGE